MLEDGKLKPGIYKIQNVVGQTYAGLREYTRELCCRPATALEGNGLVDSCPRPIHTVVIVMIFSGKSTLRVLDIPHTWYSRGLHCNLTAVLNSIIQHEPGKPEQFCIAPTAFTNVCYLTGLLHPLTTLALA